MQHRFLTVVIPAILATATSVTLAADPAKSGATAQPAPSAAPAATTTTTTRTVPTKTAKPAKKPKPVDINSASAEQLKTVPGVDDARAEKIIKNRPYPTRAYLVTKGVYEQDEYYNVKDFFVATQPASTKAAPRK